MSDTATNLPDVSRPSFDPNALREITSFADAEALLSGAGIGIYDAADEIGDGFAMLDDKNALVDIPMILVSWLFAEGDFGNDYCIARVVTGEGKKFVITDGGTGFASQIRDYEKRTGRTAGLLVKRGLRRSDYVNEFGPGTTYYLNV